MNQLLTLQSGNKRQAAANITFMFGSDGYGRISSDDRGYQKNYSKACTGLAGDLPI